MGRARRNQRDAIRKQRAKKRKKGQDDSDDDDGYVIPFSSNNDNSSISLLRNRTETTTREPVQNVSKRQKDQATFASVDCKAENIEESSESTATTKKDESKASAPIKAGATKKAPMDRIERMRLKKQQQKARRKEKKAAKMKLMQS